MSTANDCGGALNCARRRCRRESSLGQLRRTPYEQISSGLPLKADITQYSRHVSKVPQTDKARRRKIPAYSISSSAMLSKPEEMVSPSALAVFMLMASSNLVGCKTGRSAGFLPIRIWPVRVPPCWYSSAALAP